MFHKLCFEPGAHAQTWKAELFMQYWHVVDVHHHLRVVQCKNSSFKHNLEREGSSDEEDVVPTGEEDGSGIVNLSLL